MPITPLISRPFVNVTAVPVCLLNVEPATIEVHQVAVGVVAAVYHRAYYPPPGQSAEGAPGMTVEERASILNGVLRVPARRVPS
jgi:hypothetical protein